MAVLKKENKIKKWEKRIKAYELTDPKMAERLKGKLASLKGQKS